jgi:hypothetical protein
MRELLFMTWLHVRSSLSCFSANHFRITQSARETKSVEIYSYAPKAPIDQ